MCKTHRAVLWQLVGLLLVVTALVMVMRLSAVTELVSVTQQRVAHWGAWSAVSYPLLFALCNLLLLPGGVVTIGAGFFFGLWWGFFLVALGNAISAAVSFGLSRSIARGWVQRKVVTNPTLAKLEPAVQREGWKIIFLSQLHPLFPTSLLNYLYGLTSVRFGTYMVWTVLGRVPGLFLYAYIGTLGQLGVNVARGRTHPRVIEYWTWGGAFILTALLFALLSRIALRAMREAETAAQHARDGDKEVRIDRREMMVTR